MTGLVVSGGACRTRWTAETRTLRRCPCHDVLPRLVDKLSTHIYIFMRCRCVRLGEEFRWGV